MLKINKKQFDHEVFLFYIFLYSCSNRKWSVNIRLQEKYGKIRNRGTLELDQFFAVNMLEMGKQHCKYKFRKAKWSIKFFLVLTPWLLHCIYHTSQNKIPYKIYLAWTRKIDFPCSFSFLFFNFLYFHSKKETHHKLNV